jgi:hypothetical protein
MENLEFNKRNSIQMPNNKIEDLRNHLFAQIERLSDENLKEGELELECDRADAIAKIAANIINLGNAEIKFIQIGGKAGADFLGGQKLVLNATN